MSSNEPTLHLLCGKIAAGKSTLAKELAFLPRTLIISEDQWLSRIYPNEMVTVDDYIRCSARQLRYLDASLSWRSELSRACYC
ncbi:AAA family ATPase [Sodalis sp. dw_96]|uniref:AAA family ATPase n=1 Tax=Sodalis sp. dw_96 TaxID=2719794 RepID=UPI001BD29D13|nr:AAA family ATPase [Sodalis sp. dw_96]